MIFIITLYNIAIVICLLNFFSNVFFFQKLAFRCNENKTVNVIPIVDYNAHINLMYFIILLLLDSIIICFIVFKVGKLFNLLFIPMVIIFWGQIIIRPMLFFNKSPWFINCFKYSIFSLIIIIYLNKINISSLFAIFHNSSIIMLFNVLLLMLKIYIYIFLTITIFTYFIKNLLSRKFLVKKIKFDLKSKLKVNLKKTFKKRHSGSRKSIIAFTFFYETLLNLIKPLLYYIVSIFVDPIKAIICLFLEFIFYITSIKDERLHFLLCKIVLILTFVITYVTVLNNSKYSINFVNIFGYISSAIIIPLILESINSYKNIVNKKEQ